MRSAQPHGAPRAPTASSPTVWTAALLRGTADPAAETVEMPPLEPKLARGSESVARRALRGPRRPRATLRAAEIVPPKKR